LKKKITTVGYLPLIPRTTQYWIEWDFIFQFCDVAKTGNHPQEDVAKFGYSSAMKADNFQSPFIFWLPAGNLLKESDDSNIYFQNLAN